MRNEAYSATAFWSPLSESGEEGAGRAETFFRLLAECHPSLSRWYEEGRSAEEPLQLGFEPTREALLTRAVVADVMRVLVKVWEPD